MIKKENFGSLDDEKALLYTLTNPNGIRLVVSDFGASLIQLWVKDKNEKLLDVTLGYPDFESYVKRNAAFFGGTIGRNANRIGNASFELKGNRYELYANEGENNLHSGPDGYHLRLWQVKEIDERQNKITFELHSCDGDQGYPGECVVQVSYELTKENEVVIAYQGQSDKATLFNPTNHSYFNLNGQASGDVLGHVLWIDSDYYTPVRDESCIPTGELARVDQTAMDFTVSKKIGKEIQSDFEQLKFANGYDHNFVLNNTKQAQVIAEGDKSGIRLALSTNSAGIQFYSGNFLEGILGKENLIYQKYAGFCLETQCYPNAVNEKFFPSAMIEAGQKTEYVTRFTFSSK